MKRLLSSLIVAAGLIFALPTTTQASTLSNAAIYGAATGFGYLAATQAQQQCINNLNHGAFGNYSNPCAYGYYGVYPYSGAYNYPSYGYANCICVNSSYPNPYYNSGYNGGFYGGAAYSNGSVTTYNVGGTYTNPYTGYYGGYGSYGYPGGLMPSANYAFAYPFQPIFGQNYIDTTWLALGITTPNNQSTTKNVTNNNDYSYNDFSNYHGGLTNNQGSNNQSNYSGGYQLNTPATTGGSGYGGSFNMYDPSTATSGYGGGYQINEPAGTSTTSYGGGFQMTDPMGYSGSTYGGPYQINDGAGYTGSTYGGGFQMTDGGAGYSGGYQMNNGGDTSGYGGDYSMGDGGAGYGGGFQINE